MKMNWNKMKVKDFAQVISGGTPSTNILNFWGGNISWITPKDLSGYKARFISHGERNITEEGLLNSSARLLPKNTVLLTTRAPIGYVAISENELATNQGFKNLICNEEIAHFEFVYYMLKNSKGLLESHATGSTFKELPSERLKEIYLPIPPLIIQKKIASILSGYDSLIENNRRRIQLLEQSARLLYREWFVHLRFPGHEHVRIIEGVPEGWEKSTVGEKVVLNYGKALNADDRIEGSYPVYGSSGVIGTHEKSLVKGPGIIVGRKGNVGSIFWSHKDFYPIDTVYFIDSETSNYYLYHSLQNMQFINSDVAVPGLNRNLAYSRPYIIPDRKLLSLFEGLFPLSISRPISFLSTTKNYVKRATSSTHAS